MSNRTHNQGEGPAEPPFWEVKSLDQMTTEQWESLCDGCGRCCLIKLEDEEAEGGKIYFTNVACRLLDLRTCACSDYVHRREIILDCVDLKDCEPSEFRHLPKSCAYRRLAEGRPLAAWHPLISGDPDSVHAAGVSVQDKALSEDYVPDDALEFHIIEWVD